MRPWGGPVVSTCSICPAQTNVTGSPWNRDRGNHRRQVPPAPHCPEYLRDAGCPALHCDLSWYPRDLTL